MKKRMNSVWCFFLLFFINLHSSEQAKNIDLAFNKAHSFYKEKEFEAALKLYQEIEPKTSALFYNIGNCYYKLNQYSKALAAWKKAQHDWGWRSMQELRHNIFQAEKKLNLISEKSSGLKSLTSLFNTQVTLLLIRTPVLWFQLLALISWILLFGYISYARRKKKKIVTVPLFMTLALVVSLLGLKYGQKSQVQAIVINSDAVVRSGPGDDFQSLSTIPEGTTVTVKKNVDGYAKIQSAKATIGWISINHLDYL